MATSPHHDAENPPKDLDGNKTATFEPRQLNIVWGNDTRYWKIPKDSPAELLQVCWLEVSGSIPCAEKGKKYKISFSVSLKSDAFGWNNCPVYVMAKFGKKGKYSWIKKSLVSSDQGKIDTLDLVIDYTVDSVPKETIYFGLYEVWSGKWKGGLLLHKAIVEQVN